MSIRFAEFEEARRSHIKNIRIKDQATHRFQNDQYDDSDDEVLDHDIADDIDFFLEAGDDSDNDSDAEGIEDSDVLEEEEKEEYLQFITQVW